MKSIWERLQSLSQEDKDRYRDEELREIDFHFEEGLWQDAEPKFSPYFSRKGSKVYGGFERA